MSQILPKAALLLNPIILAIVLAYAYSWAKRLEISHLQRNIMMGSIMGVAAALAMLNPLILAEGVIIDMRHLIVGLAGAFFGGVGLARHRASLFCHAGNDCDSILLAQ